jgi:pterin-4a-carbinolamine dehydratase
MREIFISYRRSDSAGAAHWLRSNLARTFGPTTVFMDTEAIRAASDWRRAIEEALHASRLVIAVIGSSWLRTCDQYGRRRLDLEDDWVRLEIAHALSTQKQVLPLLLDGIELPPAEALPRLLQPLCDTRLFSVRQDSWERDAHGLFKEIARIGRGYGLTPAREERLYPAPRDLVAALSDNEVKDLKRDLPDWTLVSKYDVNAESGEALGLARDFEFDSFEQALDFMVAAKPFISKRGHHPDWRNVWRTVTVWLTSWDIGHRPSAKDRALAEELDSLYHQDPARWPGTRAHVPTQPSDPTVSGG